MAFLNLTLTACASTAKNPQDALEGINRAMFRLNDEVDRFPSGKKAKFFG